MTNHEIRLQMKTKAYALSQRTKQACHVSVSEAVNGHMFMLFATTDSLPEAKPRVLQWLFGGVPINAVELHLAALDRKIQKLNNEVADDN